MSQESDLQLRCLPAGNGDCLIIGYGAVPRRHIIVDFGYLHTYNTHLRPILEKFTGEDSIERVIISHIDADHIAGAIAFLSDPWVTKLAVGDIWHNSLRHLYRLDPRTMEPSAELQQLRRRIVARGMKPAPANQSRHPVSAFQGTSVAALLLKQALPWNRDFVGLAVNRDHRRRITLGGDASIFLLSPGDFQLNALKSFWISELKKFKAEMPEYSEGYDDAFELCMSWERRADQPGPRPIASGKSVEELLNAEPGGDRTITNSSSIAFVMEYNHLKVLLLADAHSEVVVKSLEDYGKGSLYFDLIKVSHHGSLANISEPLLEKIDSSRYLFSSDGRRHHHPDKETIAHIIHRKSTFTRQLIFNYKTKSSEYFDREDWKATYGYTVQYLSQNDYISISNDHTV